MWAFISSKAVYVFIYIYIYIYVRSVNIHTGLLRRERGCSLDASTSVGADRSWFHGCVQGRAASPHDDGYARYIHI